MTSMIIEIQYQDTTERVGCSRFWRYAIPVGLSIALIVALIFIAIYGGKQFNMMQNITNDSNDNTTNEPSMRTTFDPDGIWNPI